MSARSGQIHRRPSRPWLVVALACAWGPGFAEAEAPAGHTVVIEAVKFQPETLTIKRGATVTWINGDSFPHNVTAPGAFKSHDIRPGRSWKFTAKKAGEYAYTCTLHPNMKGALKVE